MYTLDAVDCFRISEPADTYIYDIVPVAAGLAAISSDDSLRLLDPHNLNGPPLNSVRRVNTDVTCLKALNSSTEGDALVVCTAGRDGRVCVIDSRSGAKVGEVRTGKLECFLCVCSWFIAVPLKMVLRPFQHIASVRLEMYSSTRSGALNSLAYFETR